MASTAFSNFKNGLETRRSELTTQPGALLTLQDAFVNEGAEIEKREAFTKASDAAPDTFSIEASGVGVTTFGSIADPGGWTPPVTYMRLQHPAVLDGAVEVLGQNNPFAMVGVNCSTSFGGEPWVAATFADGNTYCFWATNYVPAFRNGLVIQDGTATPQARNLFIATQLRNQLASFSPEIYSVGALTNSGIGYYFDFQSVPSYPFSLVATAVSNTGGTIVAKVVSNQTDGTQGSAAATSFSLLTATAITDTVTSIKVQFNGVNWTEILGATVAWAVDITTMAAAVASQINLFQSGFIDSATSSVGVVSIALDPALGPAQNNLKIQVTTGGNTTIGSGTTTTPGGLSAVATPASVNFVLSGNKGQEQKIIVKVTGGTGTLTYKWTTAITGSQGLISFSIQNQSGNSIYVAAAGIYGMPGSASCVYTCTVTDQQANTATVSVNVTVVSLG